MRLTSRSGFYGRSERFFDKWYGKEGPIFTRPREKIVDGLIYNLRDRFGKARIADLGGGEGRTALDLAREGFEVEVIDFSRTGLEKLTRRAEEAGLRIETTHASLVETASLPDRKYQGMACIDVLQGIREEDVEGVLRYMREHVTERGILAIRSTIKTPRTSSGLRFTEYLGEIFGDWRLHEYRQFPDVTKKGKKVIAFEALLEKAA